MGRPKGIGKTGGRGSGSKNKKTLILETFAKDIVEGGMERFLQQLSKLDGIQYVNAYLQVFEFVKPKLARTDNLQLPSDSAPLNKIEIVDSAKP